MILAFLKYCYFWIDILGFLIQTFEPAPPRMFSYGVPPWACTGAHWDLVNGLLVWISKACDGPGAHKVAGIIKHLLDKTSPNIIFIWSGKVILGLGFASPNITLPDQINMILVSVLSNKCIIYSSECLRDQRTMLIQ